MAQWVQCLLYKLRTQFQIPVPTYKPGVVALAQTLMLGEKKTRFLGLIGQAVQLRRELQVENNPVSRKKVEARYDGV